jgi:hypothetical protein
MCGGSKGQSQTSQVSNYTPSPAAYNAISGALNQAQNVASLPFNLPQAPVAGFTPDQLAAFRSVNGAQGMALSYFNTASNYFGQSTTPNVSQFFNPYANAVGASLQDLFGQQASQNTGQLTQAAGGIGADRIAVGQSELAKQQALSYGQTMAGIYAPALSAAQQQEQILQGAGYGMAALGPAAQNSVLSAANAQLGTGGLQQQLAQAHSSMLRISGRSRRRNSPISRAISSRVRSVRSRPVSAAPRRARARTRGPSPRSSRSSSVPVSLAPAYTAASAAFPATALRCPAPARRPMRSTIISRTRRRAMPARSVRTSGARAAGAS